MNKRLSVRDIRKFKFTISKQKPLVSLVCYTAQMARLINNIVDINIARLVKTPKINRKLPHYLSLKEAHNILQLPTGNNEKALRDHLILELFYATGIRISELINIRMHDIRIEEGIIHILGKGSKERIVIMGDEATESLRSYLIVKK